MTKPNRASPPASMIAPTRSASSAGERDPRRRVAGGRERDDRRGDERRDRRVGAEDEDPRGPEQEVHDQRDERRVEPGDRRHARELGVRHALGHEQGGEDEARDNVAPQRGASVAAQQRESRHPTTETLGAVHERQTTASRSVDAKGRVVVSAPPPSTEQSWPADKRRRPLISRPRCAGRPAVRGGRIAMAWGACGR